MRLGTLALLALASLCFAVPVVAAVPTVGGEVFFHQRGGHGLLEVDCIATVTAVSGTRVDLECDGFEAFGVEEIGFGGSPNAVPNYWAPLDDGDGGIITDPGPHF